MFLVDLLNKDLDLIHQVDKVLADRLLGQLFSQFPGGIADQNKCDWGSSSATALDIAKANFAKSAIFDGLQ